MKRPIVMLCPRPIVSPRRRRRRRNTLGSSALAALPRASVAARYESPSGHSLTGAAGKLGRRACNLVAARYESPRGHRVTIVGGDRPLAWALVGATVGIVGTIWVISRNRAPTTWP